MIEPTFIAVTVALVVAAVLVLVVQGRKGQAENTDPPVQVSTRARAVPVALALVSLVVRAVRALTDGRELAAVLAAVGAVALAVHGAYLWSRGRPT